MGTLKADLEAAGLELIETHISWVFLGEREVFKVKRAVDLGFLDFTTPDKRRAACEAEIALNQRLAADVYLGVAPICIDAEGIHRIDGPGTVVDWAVRMRRLCDDDRADTLLRAGRLESSQVDALAARIAAFHAGARRDSETAAYGRPAAIRRNVEENFEQTRGSIEEYLNDAQAREIETWQLALLRDAARFDARVEAGRIRDGHGDLRLEHVYLRDDGSITVIDCIEFNERFRFGDVCADVAFLSMDLAWHGRVDLAERLLARYARESGDYDLYSVVDFYESYRAFVRGKVALLLASDPEASGPARERARREARRYFLLSLAYERPPLVPPKIVAVAGIIASGKSHVAEIAAAAMAAPVLGSDRLRKQRAGYGPTDSLRDDAWAGAYSPKASAHVYDELLRLADVIVSSGRPVVIDASFRSKTARRAFRDLASRHGIPFLMIECQAPREVLKGRLAARERAEHQESDARVDLLEEFERRFEPIVDLPQSEHVRLDTSKPAAETKARVEEALFG